MKRLILTLGIGPAGQAFLKVSLPYLAAYARRIGAECRVITQGTQADPLMRNFEKFQIQSYFQHYERIAYFDADVIVMPQAPDIFKATEPACFAAWAESSLHPRPELIIETQERLGAVENWTHTIFNMGIFVAARRHAALFDPVAFEFARQIPSNASPRFSDQLYLNWNLHRLKIPCQTLPLPWNWNPICGYIHPRANFVHFLGDGFFEPARDRSIPPQEPLTKRLRQMEALASVMEHGVGAAEPALDLCVKGPTTRSAVALPPYFLPAGAYEAEFELAPSVSAESQPVGCVLFGKKTEGKVVARWEWRAEESRVTRFFTTDDLSYPHFCFSSDYAAERVTGLKIRWRGLLAAPQKPPRPRWIFSVRPAKRPCEPAGTPPC